MFDLIIPGLVTGTLIGAVGVGGILLAPWLTYLLGLDLHLAMATSSWSFLFTGIVGTIAYARRGNVSWWMVRWLSVGIVPATVAGAWTNAALPTQVLTVILAGLIMVSGANALRQQKVIRTDYAGLGKTPLIIIGLIVGFGSALTGTGGPVLLVPILLLLQIPALTAIGVSQVIQLPIAAFAALGFGLYGQIDLPLGTTLGIIQALSVLVGAFIAHRLPAQQLRRIVAVALVAVGLFMIGRVLI